MSLSLDLGSAPDGTCASGRPGGAMAFDDGRLFAVFLTISNADWCELVKYQLTNSDLEENDPRLGLVADLGIQHTIVEGYNGKGTRRLKLSPRRGPDATSRVNYAEDIARRVEDCAKPEPSLHTPSNCALCAAADCDLRDQQKLCPVPDRQR